MSILDAVKENLPAIIFRTHREVNPVGGAPLFEDELIKFSFRTIRDVEQYPRHADHLLRAITVNIDGAPRQMIASLRPTTFVLQMPSTSFYICSIDVFLWIFSITG